MKKTSLFSILSVLTICGICLSSCDLDAYLGEITSHHEHTYSEEWSYDEYNHWHDATCEDKDEGYVDELGPHTYGDPIYKEEPGCSTSGTYYYQCTVCGYIEGETINPTGEHTFGSYLYNDDTHWLICEECGLKVEASHNYELDESKSSEATCVDDGATAYTCTICQHTYYATIEKTGVHTFSEEYEADDDYHWITCLVCGETLTYEHDYVYDEDASFDSDCVTNGEDVYTCSVCNHTKIVSKPTNDNHSYGSWQATDDIHYKVCSGCGDILTEDHDYHLLSEYSYEATCGEDGLRVYQCSVCNHIKEELVEATGLHAYSGYTSYSDETHTRTCSNCGYILYESHNYEYNEEESTPSECLQHGTGVYYCSDCGHRKTEQLDYDPDNHRWYDGWIGDYNGHFTYCTLCGASKEHEAHDLTYIITGEGESSKHYQYCSICGFSYPEEDHDYQKYIEKENNCGEAGSVFYYCTTCGYYYNETTEATGDHVYGDWYYLDDAPTCTSSGYAYRDCLVCKQTDKEYQSALGHTYEGASYVDDGDGGHYQVCTRCNEAHSETESHTLAESIINAPTCTASGEKNIYCTTCDYREDNVVIPATGHSYDYDHATYTDPTCTEPGTITAQCSVCGDYIVDDVLPALGHDYEYVIEDDGHYSVCSRCEDTTAKESHTFGDAVYLDVDGHYQECEVCGGAGSYTYHTYENDICTQCSYEFPFKYTLNDDNTMTINGLNSTANSQTTVIPSHYNEYTVTSIGNNKSVLSNFGSVRYLTIPDSVETIEYHAFYRKSTSDSSIALSTITFEGNGLKTIGEGSFYWTALSSIDLPDSVETIDTNAFYEATKLEQLTLGSNLTSLGKAAFSYCTSLVTVNMNCTSLTKISSSAFAYDDALTTINIPDCVTTIDSSAFFYCHSLHEIILPLSVTTLGNWAFGTMSSNAANGLDTVYYMGTPDQKENMDLGARDTSGIYYKTVYDATWYFYSELQPSDTSNLYWHYVEGVPTPW